MDQLRRANRSIIHKLMQKRNSLGNSVGMKQN